jgi:hypothetical protein
MKHFVTRIPIRGSPQMPPFMQALTLENAEKTSGTSAAAAELN